MRNILEVKNLVRSYNTATFRDSKNNVNLLESWENPDVVRQRCLRHSE